MPQTNGALPADCIFWARNHDGLGERLRALLNAMRLAERFDRDLVFSWPLLRDQIAGLHAVIPAADFFEPDFVAAAHVEMDGMPDRPLLTTAEVRAALARGETLPDRVAISVNQTKLSMQWPEEDWAAGGGSGYRETFQALPLAAPYRAVCDRAFDVEMPARQAAIHLRAGDIIYGLYRTMDDFHGKALSYPVAMALATEVTERGLTPILFGQDEALLGYLAERFEGFVADRFIDKMGLSAAEFALADICLMSRADEIYAGTSGFAMIAGLLGGTDVRVPGKAVGVDRAYAAIVDEVLSPDRPDPRVSDLQRAFAARAALVIRGAPLPRDEEQRRLMQVARDLDPENDFYGLVVAADAYARGEPQEGEATLHAVFSGGGQRLRAFLRNENRPNARTRAKPYLDAIAPHATADNPMACLCLAIAQPATSDARAAYLERYRENPRGDLAPVVARIFAA